MQTPAQKAPTAPSAPRPSVVFQDAQGSGTFTITTPMTARQLAAIKAQREELSNQLESVDGRRSELIGQLKQTRDQTAIKGLEDRLSLLDKRQLQLESDIASTGQQLTSAPAGLVASAGTPVFGGFGSGQLVGISIVLIIFVIAPLAMGFARTIWKRSNKPALPATAFTETAQRLERLEGAVDTIAVEIERISEGQRFVTKLLSEGGQVPALSTGQRSPEVLRAGK